MEKTSEISIFLLYRITLKKASYQKQITCTQEIVDAINHGQISRNEMRSILFKKTENQIKSIKVFAQELKRFENDSELDSFKIIKNIRCYYNFQFKENHIQSSIFSDENTFFEVKFKNDKVPEPLSLEDESVIENVTSINSIIQKKNFIDCLLSQKKPPFCYDSNFLLIVIFYLINFFPFSIKKIM